MKKIKIIALALAIAMLSVCLISCGTPKIKVNAKVGVYVGEEFILAPFAVEVQNTEAPTICRQFVKHLS